MQKMNFIFGKVPFNITAEEFCAQFALVIIQNADPEEQFSVKALYKIKGYKIGKEFLLDEEELASVLDCLGIEITIPEAKDDEDDNSGVVYIGGNVTGSNISSGNGNSTIQETKEGLRITMFLTGNGITVSNK